MPHELTNDPTHSLRVRICIPQYDNQGHPINDAILQLLEETLIAVAGGWTSPGVVRGAWIDDEGTRYDDFNRIYDITVDGFREVQQLRRILNALCHLLQQKTTFLEVNHADVYIDAVESSSPAQAHVIRSNHSGKVNSRNV